MNCPWCGKWSEVAETRERGTGTLYRTRVCANLHRFGTREDYVADTSLVRQRDKEMVKVHRTTGKSAGAIALDFGVSKTTVLRAIRKQRKS